MLTGKSNIISVCFFLVRLKSLWQWMLVDCTCTISCVCLFGFRYLCFSDISICILITCISFMFQPFVLVGLGADSQKVRRLACIAVSCYLVFLKFIHKKLIQLEEQNALSLVFYLILVNCWNKWVPDLKRLSLFQISSLLENTDKRIAVHLVLQHGVYPLLLSCIIDG